MSSPASKDGARDLHRSRGLCGPPPARSSSRRLLPLLAGILLARLCAAQHTKVATCDLLEALARAERRAEAESQQLQSELIIEAIPITTAEHAGEHKTVDFWPLTLRRSAHLIGSFSTSAIREGTGEGRVRAHITDNQGRPQRALVLPAGVRLEIEGLTLVGLSGPGPGLPKEGLLASVIAGWLLDESSKGTLVFTDVALELESCHVEMLTRLVEEATGNAGLGGIPVPVTGSGDASKRIGSSSGGREVGASGSLPAHATQSQVPADRSSSHHLRGHSLLSALPNAERQHPEQRHQQQQLQHIATHATTSTTIYVLDGLELQLTSNHSGSSVTVLLRKTQLHCSASARAVYDSNSISDGAASTKADAVRASAAPGTEATGIADAKPAADVTTTTTTTVPDAVGVALQSYTSARLRRRLLAAVSGWRRGSEVIVGGTAEAGAEALRAARWNASGPGPGPSRIGRFWAAQVAAMAVALVLVGGAWIKRLLSCACMAASGTPPPDTNRPQAGGRPTCKTPTPVVARSSLNHTLEALSRFSAQLRKGEDSCRDGSRSGAAARGSAASAAAGGGGGGADGSGHSPPPAAAPLPPQLLKDLAEIKPAGQGRLATALQGIWQQQHRVVVKVLAHGEDCSFMLEQVGEVWTRLAHPNIVACFASETLPAASLAAVPAHVSELLPKLADPDSSSSSSVLHTWLVLERCENGSLAALLALRHQQQHQARKSAAAAAAAAAGADGKGGQHLPRRLGRFSRRRSAQPAEGQCPGLGQNGEAGAGLHMHGPPPAPTAFAALISSRPSADGQDLPLPPPLPLLLPPAAVPQSPQPQQSGSQLLKQQLQATHDRAGSLGGANGAEEGSEGPLPGLLPVVDVLSMAHDVASGLAYLHSLDLCHGDLRAENVLLQALVLPSGTRGTSTQGADASADGRATSGNDVGGGGGDDVAAAKAVTVAIDVAGLPYGGGASGALSAHVVGVAAVGGGNRNRRNEDALALAYGSASSRSDITDMSGVGGVIGRGGGGGGTVSAGAPRQTVSNNSSYACTLHGSCTVPDSSVGHPWSNSLRNSNGFITSSTYASTSVCYAAHAVSGMRIGGGLGGGGVATNGTTGGFDTVSIDDRMIPHGSLHADCYLGGSVRHGNMIFGNSSSRSQLGAAANGSVRALPSTGDAAAAADRQSGGIPPLSPSSPAVAALARGFGGAASAHHFHGPCSLPAGALGAAPFSSRRQSNGTMSPFFSSNSLANVGSNEVPAAAAKGPSNLAVWPESPLEGRHVTTSSSATAAGGGGASAESPSGGAGGGSGTGFARSCSTTSSGLPSLRRIPVVGGLKSALTEAPAAAPPPPPPQQLPSQPPTPQTPPSTAGGQDAGLPALPSDAPAPDTPTALLRPPPMLELPTHVHRPLHTDAANTVVSAAVASQILSPHCVALQIDSPANSSQLPSPRVSAATAAVVHAAIAATENDPAFCAAPSTPTGPAAAATATITIGGGRSSRSSLGYVQGHHGRRSSAPPVVALPIIRRVAKLTDPWLSLARMPADCAGGPWLPEAAAAVGAISGADVSHLPPELLLSGRLHPSSDVYSLAILMWRMLSPTGEAPYAKLQPAEVSYKVVACGMRPAFSPAVPEPLRRLVEDCWQSDPAARPTVPQVLQRLAELQAHAQALQHQWRERHALFGAVATVPISAVAVLPLLGEQNEVTARWAEAAGIRLLRTSTSFGCGTSGAGASASTYRGSEGSGHASIVRASSLQAISGTYAAMASYQSGAGSGMACVGGGSGSAAHMYQQPPPPTPPPLNGFAGPHALASQFNELSNHSHAASEGQQQQQQRNSASNHRQSFRTSQSNQNLFMGPYHSSQSNLQSASPYRSHMPVQPIRRAQLEPF